MKKLKIVAVCKDPGCTNNLIPVVRELRKQGHRVYLFASGAASKILQGSKESFNTVSSAKELTGKIPKSVNMLLTSMDSNDAGKPNPGRDMVPLCREKGIKTIALQDFWSARLNTDWVDIQYRPDHIIVNDNVGSALVNKAWPDFNSERIKIIGYPAHDGYHNFDIVSAAKQAKKKLRVRQDKPIVLFAGQLKGSAETLSEVVDVINYLQADVYLYPKIHPRMKDDLPSELKSWNETINRSRVPVLKDDEQNRISAGEAISVAAVVIGMYPSMLVHAALLRKQCISVLFPEIGLKEMKRNSGGLLDNFPLAQLGCCADVRDKDSLQEAFINAMNEKIDLRSSQEYFLTADGKNSKRVVNFLETI